MHNQLSTVLCSLAAASIAAFLLLASIHKIKGWHYLKSWYRSEVGSNVMLFYFLMFIIVTLEILLSSLTLWFGSASYLYSLGSSILILGLSIIGWSYFRKGKPCPCLGAASLLNDKLSIQTASYLLGVVLILYLIMKLFTALEIGTFATCSMLIISFLLGEKWTIQIYEGRTIRLVDIMNVLISKYGGVNHSTSLIFLLRVDCPACIEMAKLLERHSSSLSDNFKLFVVFKGLMLEEPRIFANGFALPDNSNEAKKLYAKFKHYPTLLVCKDNKCRQHVGLYSCRTGFSMALFERS